MILSYKRLTHPLPQVVLTPVAQILRSACFVVSLIALVLATLSVMRTGHARKLVRTSLSSGSLIVADEAVQFSPGDPETYAARAASLTKNDELVLAVDDLRRAVELRPRDYRLWTDLGITLKRLGNSQAALAALQEAQTLAPSYVRPHWESGLLLNELGRKDEAIKEFRLATASQPVLLSKVIEFAWKTFAGDCEQINRALDPRTNYERLSLALFFIKKEKSAEALGLIRLIDDLTPHDRRQLLGEFLRAEHFAEARDLWAISNLGISVDSQSGSFIYDGGFENAKLEDEIGFDWRVKRDSEVQVSIDRDANSSQNLRVDWRGSPDSSDETISQLVIVAPNTTYQLNFSARARNLVTGGAPVITVTSAHQSSNAKLAQSSMLPVSTSGWEHHSVVFTTADSTRAIRVSLQREDCATSLCPIFGTLWLDDFSLVQTSR